MRADLKSLLSQQGISRRDQLAELLGAVSAAYEREYGSVRSVVLFGGITLGEFRPRFSDIDLAIVFGCGAEVPPNRLPEAIRGRVAEKPLLADTFVSPKHVSRSTLRTMRSHDWRSWTTEGSYEQVTDTAYPFTLCDTWMLHRHGLVLAGSEALEEFPFKEAPPTTPRIELRRLKWFAGRFELAKPFGGLEGLDLAGEVIYYGTTFARVVYTLKTGRVIGRVASTRWYEDAVGGERGQYVRSLGEKRCCPDPDSLCPPDDPVADLWPVFVHYSQEVLAYAAPEIIGPDSLQSRAEYLSQLRATLAKI
ncbi:hypothetical protein LCGC14_1532180 [marine sediment metagenome]|uniref:Polymerase nucleotidyl transferase domain-containing protein n=1 Tax=marine sediment metagenome TaxID=412755 RepID=A0A0F9IVS9_9ZZZZ